MGGVVGNPEPLGDGMFFDISEALAEHLGIPLDEAWALLAP
jgi:hypothetical protein